MSVVRTWPITLHPHFGLFLISDLLLRSALLHSLGNNTPCQSILMNQFLVSLGDQVEDAEEGTFTPTSLVDSVELFRTY